MCWNYKHTIHKTYYTMKKAYIVIVTALNIYYFSLWIVSFNKFNNQEDRVVYFLNRSFVFDNIATLNSILLLMTVIAIGLNFGKIVMHRYLKTICLIVNFLILVFILWSYL